MPRIYNPGFVHARGITNPLYLPHGIANSAERYEAELFDICNVGLQIIRICNPAYVSVPGITNPLHLYHGITNSAERHGDVLFDICNVGPR